MCISVKYSKITDRPHYVRAEDKFTSSYIEDPKLHWLKERNDSGFHVRDKYLGSVTRNSSVFDTEQVSTAL